MASGAAKVVRGSFVGTGSALNVRTVGFRPRSVKVVNIDSDDEGYWQEGFADGAVYKRLKAGGGEYLGSDGITPLSDGFTFGADSDLNVDGEIVHYEATE